MKKKTKIILGVILLLLVVVIGTTYAFFTANVTTTGEDKKAEIIAKAYANATMTFGNTINSEDAIPGFKAAKSVTITGECPNNAEMCEPITAIIIVTADIDEIFGKDVTWYLIKSDTPINCENKINEVTEGEQVYSTGECEGITEELKNNAQKGNTTGTTKIDIEVTGQTNDTYYLYVEYANNGEQNDQQGREFSITVDLEGKKEEPKPLNETILLADQTEATDIEDAKEKIKNKGEPDFSTISETDDGLYMAKDDLGESYYFRGNVQDNWVYFADLYWRIIRINGDGTIRMIYNGPTNEQTGSDTQITAQSFNTQRDDPKYVGYKWGDYNEETQTYVNDNDSTIKDYLENTWFDDALGEFTDYLADEIFCNDRSITSGNGSSGENYFGAYERLRDNKSPILTCVNINDRFAIGLKVGNVDTNGQIAKGKPVGLITVDEASIAGGMHENENNNYYLFTARTYYTMSPAYSRPSGNASEFYVGAVGGVLNMCLLDITAGIRPVINLKSNVTVIGTGSSSDPYVVENV